MADDPELVTEGLEALPVSDEELDILDCLRDYHRILANVHINGAGLNGANKRAAALLRARQVAALIQRLEDLACESEAVN